MNTNLEQLEALNKEHCGIKFIKTYEVLNITNLSPAKIRMIELILSFQSNDQVFQMRYEVIGKRLGKSPNTIKQYVSDLKKLGLITTNPVSNYSTHTHKGGKKTYIKVNMEALTNYIEKCKKKREMPTTQEVDLQPQRDSVSPTKEVNLNPIKPTPTVAVSNKTPAEALPEAKSDNIYRFRLSDFNARKMLLRYTDGDETFDNLIKDFDKWWVKNGTGILELPDLVGYLINKLNNETNTKNINIIKLILDGITNDNEKLQQQTA